MFAPAAPRSAGARRGREVVSLLQWFNGSFRSRPVGASSKGIVTDSHQRSALDRWPVEISQALAVPNKVRHLDGITTNHDVGLLEDVEAPRLITDGLFIRAPVPKLAHKDFFASYHSRPYCTRFH